MQYVILNVYDREVQEGYYTLVAAQEVADDDAAHGCEEDQVVLEVGDDDVVVAVYFHNGDDWVKDDNTGQYNLVGQHVEDL